VRGRVLKTGDDSYTRRFGAEGVDKINLLHAMLRNPVAAYLADLTDASQLHQLHFDGEQFSRTPTEMDEFLSGGRKRLCYGRGEDQSARRALDWSGITLSASRIRGMK
jgi:hypothetical protein